MRFIPLMPWQINGLFLHWEKMGFKNTPKNNSAFQGLAADFSGT